MKQQQKLSKLSYLGAVAIVGLIVQAVFTHFGIRPEEQIINDIITAVCGLLAFAGIIAPKSNVAESVDQKEKSADDKTDAPTIEDN